MRRDIQFQHHYENKAGRVRYVCGIFEFGGAVRVMFRYYPKGAKIYTVSLESFQKWALDEVDM